MNLNDIIPPLELCKLIPEGEFADSVLIWMEVEASATMEKTWSLMEGTPYARNRPNRKIPAPTLQELIVALSDISVSSIKVCKSFNEWHVECCVPIEYGERFVSEDSSKNAATAALKLWLELKGIEA